MSTTIRNIKVIIDGIRSQGFNITIDGNAYRMDDFSLSQHLLVPASLSFSIHRHEAEEDSKDATFSLSGRLIGKTIRLELSTDNVESESSISDNEEKTADVKFLGIIKSVSCNRISTGYTLYVSAESWEYLLDSNLDCMSFENKTLKEILEEVAADYLNDPSHSHKMQVDTEYTDKIPYCVMYNETQLHFIQRLALRYSEWMYNDGEKLVFGKLPEIDPVTLEYPGRDIENFSVNLTTVSHNFSNGTQSHYDEYNGTIGGYVRYSLRHGEPKLSELQKKVFDASEPLYRRKTVQTLVSGGYTEKNHSYDLSFVQSIGQARVQLSQLVRYSGSTYSSRIKIGCRLQIKDNVVTSDESETHSDVNQEDILIIGLTHTFYANETYSNVFEGIPGVCMYPPYPEGETIVKAGPMRGTVTNNNDPEGLGRVRVMLMFHVFQTQTEDKEFHIDDVTNAQTPWIRVVQLYDTAKFVPEVGKSVLVEFEEGNVDRPFVAGTFWEGNDPMDPEWTLKNNDNNEVKALRSWNGHTVEFHDVGPEQGGFIHVYDQAKKYDVLLSTDGELIRMCSAGDIHLIAKKDIVLQAGEQVGAIAGETISLLSEGSISESTRIRRVDVEQRDTLVVGDKREVFVTNLEAHRGNEYEAIFEESIATLADKSGFNSITSLKLDSNKLNTKSKVYEEKTESYSSESKKYSVKTQDSSTETTKYSVEAKADASIKSKAKMAIESQIMNVDATQVQIQGKANASISAPSVTIN